MKKLTTSLRITLLLLLINMTNQSSATPIVSSVLTKAISSKKAFTEFCASVYKKTGISSEWVNNLFQNIVHGVNTDLVLKLFPTLTAEKVSVLRELLIKNEIFDVTASTPVEMTSEELDVTATAIARFLNIGSSGKFTAEVTSQATTIATKAQVPVSKVYRYAEKLTAYNDSPVFSAKALSTAARN